MASIGPSFAGFTPGGQLPPEVWQQLASLYSNPSSLQALRDMNGGGSEYTDPATGLNFAPKFREINGNQIFDGGTVYQIHGKGDYKTPGYVFDASGKPTDPGFQIEHSAPSFMDNYGFMIPLLAAGGAAAFGPVGAGTGATGATTAPVLGSTGALAGTPLGAAGAGAAGVAGAAGAAGGGAAAAGGAGVLSSLGGWSSLIGPAASLVGGAIQAGAAGDAADAMVGEANKARELLAPYVQAGNTSLGAYQALSGAGGPDAQRAAMAELESSPQFASMTKAGENAILQNASATGGLRGGNIQTALYDQRAQLLNGLQQQRLGNYLPIINGGQNSAAGTGQIGMQAGAAQAGGIVAGTNAITNAIGGLGGFFAGQQAGNVSGTSTPAPYASTMAAPQMGTTGSFGTGVIPGYSFQPRYF